MPLELDQKYYQQGYKLIVGIDEAGRGCLLGPVVASAVILPQDFYDPLINDSKQLTEKQREKAFAVILEHALAIGVGMCSPEEIDKMNILNASREAMMRALKQLKIDYDFILTDAMKLYDINKPYEAIIHGDALSINIAAASIIAKVTRDHICIELEKQYPNFKSSIHKGYGTKKHLEELATYGPVKGLHRFSYSPVQNALLKKVTLF